MSEPTKQDQIIERIKKLMKHAESAKQLGSLQEAEAFAAKANEMLLEHNLTMHQIAMSAEKDEDEFAKYQYSEYLRYSDNQSGNEWKFRLAKVLASHNLCGVVFVRRFKEVQIYGQMSNVDTVVWLWNFLSIALLRIAQESHIKNKDSIFTNRYAYLKNFLIGACAGLDSKMYSERHNHAHAAKINDLVVYNSKALKRFLNTTAPHIKVEKNRKSKLQIGEGWGEGYQAGLNVKINKPLKATSTVEGRLLGNK